ncbi:MAG: hypothetical protein ACK56I_02700, partial [bacterium]
PCGPRQPRLPLLWLASLGLTDRRRPSPAVRYPLRPASLPHPARRLVVALELTASRLASGEHPSSVGRGDRSLPHPALQPTPKASEVSQLTFADTLACHSFGFARTRAPAEGTLGKRC